MHLPPPGEHPAAARVRRGPGLGPRGSRCARAYTSTGLTRCLLRPGSHSAALGGLSAGTCEATSAGSDRPALPPRFLCSLACALCSDCAELTRCFLNDFIEIQRTNASVRICGLVFLSAFSTIRVWNIPRRTPVPSAVARIPPVPPPHLHRALQLLVHSVPIDVAVLDILCKWTQNTRPPCFQGCPRAGGCRRLSLRGDRWHPAVCPFACGWASGRFRCAVSLAAAGAVRAGVWTPVLRPPEGPPGGRNAASRSP